MKKLLMMAAVVAMAFGAQAENATSTYTYTFQLAIDPNTAAAGGHKELYLVSKDGATIYACMNYAEWFEFREQIGKEYSVHHDNGTDKPTYLSAPFADATVIDHTIKGATSSDADPTKWQFSMIVQTPFDISGLAKHFTTDDKGFILNVLDDVVLAAIAVKGDGEYNFEAPVTITPDQSGIGYVLAAGYGYKNVPEPTSAMLLLLGVAGLALKRKVA